MAQDKKDKAKWATHVRSVLGAKGWDATRLAAEAERLTGDPDSITYKTANNWWSERVVPGAEAATIFAETTGADLGETLDASGHPRLAAKVAELQAGDPAHAEGPLSAPAPAEHLEQFQAGLREIRARGLPPARLEAAIEDFTRRSNRTVAFVFGEFLSDATEVRNDASKSA